MNSLVTRGSLFDDFFKDIAPGFYVRPLHGEGVPSPTQIKVDVKETDGGYTVQAEVPGVPKEDIQVSIDGNVVSLRAEVRQHDQKTEGEMISPIETETNGSDSNAKRPLGVKRGRQPQSDLVGCGCRKLMVVEGAIAVSRQRHGRQ